MTEKKIHLCRLVANQSDPVAGARKENCSQCGAEVWVKDTPGQGGWAMVEGGAVVPAHLPPDVQLVCGWCAVDLCIQEGDVEQSLRLIEMVAAVEGKRP